MCTSDPVAKNGVIEYIKDCGLPKSIFDIGMGRGEYGAKFKRIDNSIYMVGLEIFAGYIRDDWGFSTLYDKVYVADMRTFDYSKVKIGVDLVIAGDVIEHVEKDEGIKVIEKLRESFKWGIIVVPIIDFFQGANNKYGNIHEEHKYQWKPDDMVKSTGLKYVKPVGVCGLFEWKNE